MNLEEQIRLNNYCLKALNDAIDDDVWIKKYQLLFDKCTIRPRDRPSISMAFHNGVFYKEMNDFVTKYSNLIDPPNIMTDEDYANL